MLVKEADEILKEFLRARVEEPIRYSENSTFTRRHSTVVEYFSGDSSTRRFTLTYAKLLCIRLVKISATEQSKYIDYDIDLKNNQILFTTAPTTGTNNIYVEYDYNTTGKSWIYNDKPRTDLAFNSYPRIAVIPLDENGSLLGLFDNDMINDLRFQIDVVTKRGMFMDFFRGEKTITIDTSTGGSSGNDISLSN